MTVQSCSLILGLGKSTLLMNVKTFGAKEHAKEEMLKILALCQSNNKTQIHPAKLSLCFSQSKNIYTHMCINKSIFFYNL